MAGERAIVVAAALLLGGEAWAETGVCAALLGAHPTAEGVRAALAEGDNPSRRCNRHETRRAIDTLGGALAAALLPVPFLPLGFVTKVEVKRKATPLGLAIGHVDIEIVRALLDAGAKPHGVDAAVRVDRFDSAWELITAGADPFPVRAGGAPGGRRAAPGARAQGRRAPRRGELGGRRRGSPPRSRDPVRLPGRRPAGRDAGGPRR